MTLANVQRYDHTRLSDVGDHAVILGGGIAGLLSARVLADGFGRVTLVERDSFPQEVSARRGVPQGRHVHVLEEAGRATLEDLFPGFGEELLSAGGLIVDSLSDFVHYEEGDFLADGDRRYDAYYASRPLFEQVVRRRVDRLDGVELRTGHRFVDYVLDDAAGSVEGVVVRDDDAERTLRSDLVVDATGRASKTPRTLERNGYAAPDVDEVTVDLAYSTAVVERPPDNRRAFFVAPDPPRTRGVGMFPVEGDRWFATLFGYHGDHPPTDVEGVLEFAASLPIDEPRRLLGTQEWVSEEIAHYPFPSNRRRRFEALDRFPDDLVVTGDAVASFNPIYGQGMSVAALEALQLHHALAAGGRTDLPRRFFDSIEAVVDVPWTIAVGGDFEFPQTSGPKPPGTDLVNRYLSRLTRAAHTDWELREPMLEVFFLERPPRILFRPGVAWRAFSPGSDDVPSLESVQQRFSAVVGAGTDAHERAQSEGRNRERTHHVSE